MIKEECEEGNMGSHLKLYKRESKHKSKGTRLLKLKTEQVHFRISTNSTTLFSIFLT